MQIHTTNTNNNNNTNNIDKSKSRINQNQPKFLSSHRRLSHHRDMIQTTLTSSSSSSSIHDSDIVQYIQDNQSLTITVSSSLSSQQCNAVSNYISQFMTEVLAYGQNWACIIYAVREDPNCLLAMLFAADYFIACENIAIAMECRNLARKIYTRYQHLLTNREKLYMEAYNHWMDGSFNEAFILFERITHEYPQDLFAAKRGQLLAFLVGNVSKMISILENPKVKYHCSSRPYYQGMLAFALEQSDRLDEALEAGLIGTKLHPGDSWSHHGCAHTLYFQARLLDGVHFLLKNAKYWERCMSFMFTHNWFHVALMFVDLDDYKRMFMAFDTAIWDMTKGGLIQTQTQRQLNSSTSSSYQSRSSTSLLKITHSDRNIQQVYGQRCFLPNFLRELLDENKDLVDWTTESVVSAIQADLPSPDVNIFQLNHNGDGDDSNEDNKVSTTTNRGGNANTNTNTYTNTNTTTNTTTNANTHPVMLQPSRGINLLSTRKTSGSMPSSASRNSLSSLGLSVSSSSRNLAALSGNGSSATATATASNGMNSSGSSRNLGSSGKSLSFSSSITSPHAPSSANSTSMAPSSATTATVGNSSSNSSGSSSGIAASSSNPLMLHGFGTLPKLSRFAIWKPTNIRAPTSLTPSVAEEVIASSNKDNVAENIQSKDDPHTKATSIMKKILVENASDSDTTTTETTTTPTTATTATTATTNASTVLNLPTSSNITTTTATATTAPIPSISSISSPHTTLLHHQYDILPEVFHGTPHIFSRQDKGKSQDQLGAIGILWKAEIRLCGYQLHDDMISDFKYNPQKYTPCKCYLEYQQYQYQQIQQQQVQQLLQQQQYQYQQQNSTNKRQNPNDANDNDRYKQSNTLNLEPTQLTYRQLEQFLTRNQLISADMEMLAAKVHFNRTNEGEESVHNIHDKDKDADKDKDRKVKNEQSPLKMMKALQTMSSERIRLSNLINSVMDQTTKESRIQPRSYLAPIYSSEHGVQLNFEPCFCATLHRGINNEVNQYGKHEKYEKHERNPDSHPFLSHGTSISELDHRWFDIRKHLRVNSQHNDPFFDIMATYCLGRVGDYQLLDQFVEEIDESSRQAPVGRREDLLRTVVPFCRALQAYFYGKYEIAHALLKPLLGPAALHMMAKKLQLKHEQQELNEQRELREHREQAQQQLDLEQDRIQQHPQSGRRNGSGSGSKNAKSNRNKSQYKNTTSTTSSTASTATVSATSPTVANKYQQKVNSRKRGTIDTFFSERTNSTVNDTMSDVSMSIIGDVESESRSNADYLAGIDNQITNMSDMAGMSNNISNASSYNSLESMMGTNAPPSIHLSYAIVDDVLQDIRQMNTYQQNQKQNQKQQSSHKHGDENITNNTIASDDLDSNTAISITNASTNTSINANNTRSRENSKPSTLSILYENDMGKQDMGTMNKTTVTSDGTIATPTMTTTPNLIRPLNLKLNGNDSNIPSAAHSTDSLAVVGGSSEQREVFAEFYMELLFLTDNYEELVELLQIKLQARTIPHLIRLQSQAYQMLAKQNRSMLQLVKTEMTRKIHSNL